jgi:hypothetical protein
MFLPQTADKLWNIWTFIVAPNKRDITELMLTFKNLWFNQAVNSGEAIISRKHAFFSCPVRSHGHAISARSRPLRSAGALAMWDFIYALVRAEEWLSHGAAITFMSVREV